MIHCHCEPLKRLLPELPPLLQAHWDESEAALFGPQVYALDTERYACWERLGMLHVVTARDSSGRLQGYAAFTLTDCRTVRENVWPLWMACIWHRQPAKAWPS